MQILHESFYIVNTHKNQSKYYLNIIQNLSLLSNKKSKLKLRKNEKL